MHWHNKLFPTVSILFASVLFLIFSSCSQQSQTETSTVPPDSVITETIRSQLASTAYTPHENIDVNTNNGIVKLSGSTTNLLAKQNSTDIAQAVSGVISVVNNLQVAISRPDEAVSQDIARALQTDPATESWEIGIEVNNGLATLTGSVDSWQEKQLAGTITSGVKGVKEIKNNIMVSATADRSASNIRAEIKNALLYDSRIRANMVNVEVSENTVTLSGAVGSAKERQVAINRAHVQGVQTVDAEKLEVKPELTSEMFVDKAINSLSPDEIKKAIKRAMFYDPRVPADQISVEMTEGTAILSGSVKNLNSKLAAAKDAQNTQGVQKIENNIMVERMVVVEPEVPTTDEAIKTRIKNIIRRDPYVDVAMVKEITVDDGIVVLSGNVNSMFEKQHIQKLTSDVKGVIAVKNGIKAESEES